MNLLTEKEAAERPHVTASLSTDGGEGMMGKQITATDAPKWHVSVCENCHESFGTGWLSDCSPSGELIWQCPQCGIPYARTRDALIQGFIRNEPAEGYLYPQDGDWRFMQVVQRSSLAKIDSIREQAVSLGWNEARLYQNRSELRFPCGEDYGLVCFVFENVETVYEQTIVRKRTIGEVTRQHIEIVGHNFGIRPHPEKKIPADSYSRHPSPVEPRLHFFNPDVGQPWRRTTPDTARFSAPKQSPIGDENVR